jgi:hypothetical protein
VSALGRNDSVQEGGAFLRRHRTNWDDHDHLMAELAALHEGHARYVLGYANALLRSRHLAEEASLEVLLTGWRAGLAREADQCAIRLLLMSLVRREVAFLRRQAVGVTAATTHSQWSMGARMS